MSIDYAKIKALSQQILECIGDTAEGENPDLPEQDDAIDDGGQAEMQEFIPGSDANGKGSAGKGGGKDAAIKIMGATLGAKFKQK